MMFQLTSAFLLALSSSIDTVSAQQEAVIGVNNLINGACAVDYDPNDNVDYFPMKYRKPSINSYGNIDIFGNKFVPHESTDFLNIEYHDNYKIVTNSHQQPPKTYLLYQCGTEIPDIVTNGDFEFDLVVSVPHQGGLALTQTPQIPYVELLGLREEVIAYVGDPQYVTSPCMSYMMTGAGDDDQIQVVYDSNITIMEGLTDTFRTEHPDAIIVSGPTNNVVGDRVIVASATQERTNVATFDWIAFYASFYNLEGESNRISTLMQESYDCISDVSTNIVKQQRNLENVGEEYHTPTIFWANFFTYDDLGWSVGDCPTSDANFYCEYAAHCDATILSRPEGVGFNRTYGGSPTVYWYISDEEALEMGKNADIFIYTGGDWDSVYKSHSSMLDQFKAVQNKQVFDTLGQGPSAWLEQRYAEYNTVGLDLCDIVGHSIMATVNGGDNATNRWFRNIYTEPIGALPVCDVAGGEISQPYVPPEVNCVQPPEEGVEIVNGQKEEISSPSQEQEEDDDSAASGFCNYFSYSNLLLVSFAGMVVSQM